jgi:hypothetical protein
LLPRSRLFGLNRTHPRAFVFELNKRDIQIQKIFFVCGTQMICKEFFQLLFGKIVDDFEKHFKYANL